MAKLTKNKKLQKLKRKEQIILFKDAAALIKVIASAKFDESVDIAVRLGVDQKEESNGKRCSNITSWNW
jgi:large subunit ribosomal protein L1